VLVTKVEEEVVRAEESFLDGETREKTKDGNHRHGDAQELQISLERGKKNKGIDDTAAPEKNPDSHHDIPCPNGKEPLTFSMLIDTQKTQILTHHSSKLRAIPQVVVGVDDHRLCKIARRISSRPCAR